LYLPQVNFNLVQPLRDREDSSGVFHFRATSSGDALL
jgi:hypothetical protein